MFWLKQYFKGVICSLGFYESFRERLIEEYRGEIGGEEFMLTTYGWVSVHDLIQLIVS